MKTRNKKLRKVLALLLAFAMLLSMMPTTWAYAEDSLTVKFYNKEIENNKITLQLGTTKMINVNKGVYAQLYKDLRFSFKDSGESSYADTSEIIDISATPPGGTEASANPGLASVYVKSLKPGTTTVKVEYTDNDQLWTTFDVEVVETGEITGIYVRPYLDDSQYSQPQDKIYYAENGTRFYIDPVDMDGKSWPNHLYFSDVNWSLSDGGSLPNYIQNIVSSTGITFKSPPEGINDTLVATIPNLKLESGATEDASTSFTVKTKAPEYTCTLLLQAGTKTTPVTIADIEQQLDNLGVSYSPSSSSVEISGANLASEAELNELYSKYGLSQSSNWDMNEFLAFVNEHFFGINDPDSYIIKPQHLHDYEKSYFNMSGDDGFFILTLDMLPGSAVEPVDDSQSITVTLVNRNGDGKSEEKTYSKGEWINPIYDFPSDSPDYPVTSWTIEGESSAIQGPIVLTNDITLNAINNVPPHYVRIVILEDDQETDLIHLNSINEFTGQKYTPTTIGSPQELNGVDRDYTYKVSLTEYKTLYDGSYSDSEEERAALYDFMEQNGLIQEDETEFYKTSITQYDKTIAGQKISVANDEAIQENTTLTIATFVVSFWPQPMGITPADVTIYTGGDGYEGAINANGTELGVQSGFPEPGFTVEAPDGVADFDPTQATLKYNDGTTERTWKIVPYDGVENAEHDIYRFEPAEETDKTPVRMQFTLEDGTTVTDDGVNFDDLLYEELTMEVYGQGIDAKQVTLEYGGLSYLIDAGTGTLTVRGTTGNTATPLVNDPIVEGEAGIEVPAGTTYYINNQPVTVADPSGIALLFDDIIENNDIVGTSNTDLLIDKTDETIANLGNDSNLSGSGTRHYECKYLDLVDTNNGNVWVAADNDVTVSWPLPEGTNGNTKFELIHFPGLHREMGVDVIENEIDDCEPEQMEITNTGTHIEFNVSRANFSPFVLVWETSSGSGGGKPPVLNTEDHFSYVVGYPEDYRTGEPSDNEELWPVKPQGNITRAEVASIFYRLLKDDVRDANTTDVSEFSDVKASDWYGTTVATLSAMDIVRGYEDGTFRPNAPITRAEFAAIATRFFEETGAEYEPGTFDDVTGNEWFANAIADAVELGLIGGYPDGTVRPNNNITRAEACAVINRTLGRIPHVDHLLPADEMKTWPDNHPSDWFYADMQEATNGHEYEWTTEDGQKVEEWTAILDKDWNSRSK